MTISSITATRGNGPLADAYVELEMPRSVDTVELATRAALACDLPRLRALAIATSDPMPWRGFLRRLAEVPHAQQTPTIRRAWAQLYALGIEMLREQGLGLLRPEDVLLSGGALERAIDGLVSPEPD